MSEIPRIRVPRSSQRRQLWGLSYARGMDDTENAREVAERYREAWLANDLAGILDCYADDFSLHYFGDNPWSGSHVGKQAAIEHAARRRRQGAPPASLAVDEVLAGPNAAVLVAREEIDDHAGGTRRDPPGPALPGTGIALRRLAGSTRRTRR